MSDDHFACVMIRRRNRTRSVVLRLQNIGRLQFIELALTLPVWTTSTTSVPAPLPPALPLAKLLAQARREQPRHFALGVFAFVLLGLVLFLLPATGRGEDYTPIVFVWLFAFANYAVALVPAHPPIHWARLRARLPIVFAVSGVVFLALALRVWDIGAIPFTLGGDEASQGLESLRMLRGEIRSPFITGWYSVPTMSFFFNGLSLGGLGANITALRLPWAFIGTLSVLVTFGLATRLAGLRIGLLTAGLLAVYHYHIHYSRLGSNQIADPLFVSLALYFFYRALARQRAFDWLMLGVACAGSLYFYAGARLTIILVLVVLVYHLAHDRMRFWQTQRIGLLIALGAFLIVGAPMLQYASLFPDEFNARVNQIGIFQSGWLEQEVEIRGARAESILWDQFVRAALAFNFYPDRTVWYGLRAPLLDPIFGALFLLGLGYATIRSLTPRAERRFFPMVAWWWGAVILGGMLTESPPSSQRLISLSVPVCFFIALALWRILRLARQAIAGVPVNALSLAALLLFAFISLKTYFADYTPQRIYGSARAELATLLAPMLNQLAPTHRFYFVGAPFMYWGFATLPFLVPNADAVDVAEPMTAPPARDLIRADKGAVFIVLQERADELRFIQQTWERGDAIEVRAPSDGRILATLYVISQ